MKKIVLGIFLFLLSIGSYSYANCGSLKYCGLDDGGMEICVSPSQQCPGDGASNSTSSDPCKGKVTPSIGNGACIEPKADKTACGANANTASSTSNLCSQRYSCESLFEGNTDNANTCNKQRCFNQRGANSPYCDCKYVQKGIPLNTSIPFLGNCIKKTGTDANSNAATDAFPQIISAATRILVTVIMLVSFVMVVIGGIQWASGNASDGKKMITKVAIGFMLLGLMGAILRLINPNFFK